MKSGRAKGLDFFARPCRANCIVNIIHPAGRSLQGVNLLGLDHIPSASPKGRERVHGKLGLILTG